MTYGSGPNDYLLGHIEEMIAGMSSERGEDASIMKHALVELHRNISARTHTETWRRIWGVEERIASWLRTLRSVRDSASSDQFQAFPYQAEDSYSSRSRFVTVQMSSDDAEFLIDAVINSWGAGAIDGTRTLPYSGQATQPVAKEPVPVILNNYSRRLSIDVNKETDHG